MITLTAKIDLLAGNSSEWSVGDNNLIGNNISSDLNNVVGRKKSSRNPFILGSSALDGNSTFSDGENYFIGKQLSNASGNFATPYYLHIKGGGDLTSLNFSFDILNNNYPKKIEVYNSGSAENISTKIRKEITNTTLLEEPTTELGKYLPEDFFLSDFDELYLSGNSGQELYLSQDLHSAGFQILKGQQYIYAAKSEYPLFDGEKERNYFYAEIDNQYIFLYYDYYNDGKIAYGIIGSTTNYILHKVYFYYTTKTITSTEVTIKTYTVNSPEFVMTDIPKYDPLRLKITNWSTEKSPLVLTGLYTEIAFKIDRNNLLGISRSISDRSDLKLPSFGIISNTGNIEFNDTDGSILQYAEELLLQSGLKCEIFLNNTLVEGASQRIGLFETDQWEYNNNSRVVSVRIKDDLEEWQDINVGEISYDPRMSEHKSFKWLYQYLWNITKENYTMLSFEELDSNTQGVLNNTYTQYPLLESGSLWLQWTKLCQVCQLHIYKNNDGVVVCRYNGGN